MGVPIPSRGARPVTCHGRVGLVLYGALMDPKIWTAEELAGMTPAEQDAVFDRAVVTDLSEVPDRFLTRVRERFLASRHATGSR